MPACYGSDTASGSERAAGPPSHTSRLEIWPGFEALLSRLAKCEGQAAEPDLDARAFLSDLRVHPHGRSHRAA